VEQAWQMLESFASVGVSAFDLTQTGLDGRLRSFRAGLSWELLRRWAPHLIQSAIQDQRNVIVRPRGAAAVLIQLDDLSEAMLERVSRAAFLTLTTSQCNYQAWVAVNDGDPDFARRLRQGSGADPGASGAVRLAGSLNFKCQYAPDYPAVNIRQATPEHVVTRAQLESLGLVAAPSRMPGIRSRPRGAAKQWPSYERCLENAPRAQHTADRPDVSRADFTFCLLAIDWGWSLADTCRRLLEKSPKARTNGQAYARLTVARAAEAIGRRQRR
jgi:hypothetical protein